MIWTIFHLIQLNGFSLNNKQGKNKMAPMSSISSLPLFELWDVSPPGIVSGNHTDAGRLQMSQMTFRNLIEKVTFTK